MKPLGGYLFWLLIIFLFLLGGDLFFVVLLDGFVPTWRERWRDFITSLILLNLILIGIALATLRALRREPVTGREGLIGSEGVAITPIGPEGKVFLKGEIWNALSDEPIEAGRAVVVVEVIGLKVRVKEKALDK